MRRGLFPGHHADLNPLEPGRLEPPLQVAFGEAQPVIPIQRARLLETLLALMSIVLVGRLLVADQVFIPSELVALVLLLPVTEIATTLVAENRAGRE